MLELLRSRHKRDEDAERAFQEKMGKPFEAPWDDLNEGIAFVAYQLENIAQDVHATLMDALAKHSLPAPDADAELRALSAEFDALELQIHAHDLDPALTGEAFNAAADPLEDRQGELLPRMIELRATTQEGIMARARTLAIHGGHGGYSLEVKYSTCAGSMVAALMRDVLTMHGLPLPEALLEEA